MCWFTLTPVKGKKDGPARTSSDSSCVEEIVRVHRSSSPRFSDVRVKVPGGVSLEVEDEHHHHHHSHIHPHMHPHLHPHLNHHHRHLHPLHLHPLHGYHHHHDFPVVKLRGPGRKRCPPPGPPPPSRAPSRCRPHSRSRSCSPAPKEPIYRTQIVEPRQVRDTTRVALRTVEPERPRGRLRRVAGYEVLGREVPWNWDCVSSTVGSSSAGGGKWARKKRGPPYPPFGNMDRWL